MTTGRVFLGGDGWRARIGIVVPSVNTVMEPWAQRAVPAGVSVHFSRMFIPDLTTAETLIEMDRREGMAGVRQLSSTRPHAVAYGCTASSIVQGLDYDCHLRAEIEKICKVPATTAAHAIVQAARTLRASRLSLVSPYTGEVDAAEHRFFAAAGPGADGRGQPVLEHLQRVLHWQSTAPVTGRITMPTTITAAAETMTAPITIC